MKLETIVHETKSAAAATLYFLCCFLIVIALKKLILAQYEIAFYGLSAAVVGAALVGKIVVVLDKTGAGKRFESRAAPWVGILYKTLVYTSFVLLVVWAEKVFHAFRETRDLQEAIVEVWHARDRNQALATVLCVGVSFGIYNLFAAINREWADGQLVPWLLGRRAQQESSVQL